MFYESLVEPLALLVQKANVYLESMSSEKFSAPPCYMRIGV